MKLLYSYLTLLTLVSCQKKPVQTAPFQLRVGESFIRFPYTTGQLLQERQVRQDEPPLYYTTQSASMLLVWVYDWAKTLRFPPAYDTPGSTPLYGVVILLPRQAEKLDSVKRQLERQLGSPLPQRQYGSASDAAVYSYQPVPGTRVSLRLGSVEKGDYGLFGRTGQKKSYGPATSDNPQGLLRIAISYGLDPGQAERFALGQGAYMQKELD